MELGLKTTDRGFSYDRYPFPAGMVVYNMEREKVTLKVDKPTLFLVWSVQASLNSLGWQRLMDIQERYQDKGLETVAVNFKNGADFNTQMTEARSFLDREPKPTHNYLDPMGFVIDGLRVPAFPSAYLVNGAGEVIFMTRATDASGLELLESETETLVNTL